MSWPELKFERREKDTIIYCPHGYSLDCYCDHLNPQHKFEEFPHTFIGQSRADVFRQARKVGWMIHSDNSATCPKCARAKP